MATPPAPPEPMPPSPMPPPPAWTPPAAAPPARSGMWIAIVVVVIVVVLLLAIGGMYVAKVGLFAPAGSSTAGPGGGTGGGTAQTFDQAAASSSSSASGYSGGPWTLLGGWGVQIPTTLSVPIGSLNSTFAGTGCTGTTLSGASSITSFPASGTTVASGASKAWIIQYVNPSGAVLEIYVFGGTATPVFSYSGSYGCVIGATAASLPSTHEDSSAAAATAWSAGASAYAAAHSTFDAEFFLGPTTTLKVGGITTVDPSQWIVALTNCQLGGSTSATLDGKSPAQFTALIGATNGTLLHALNTTVGCPVVGGSSGGTGGTKSTFSSASLGFYMSETSAGATFWNNGTFITGTSTHLTLGDITVAIVNSGSGTPVSTAGFTLILYNGSTSTTAATYNFATNTWSSPSLSVGGVYDPVYFVLTTPMTMVGDSIQLTATSSAPVTGSISAVLGAP